MTEAKVNAAKVSVAKVVGPAKLTSKQISLLRGLAHSIDPIVQVGKSGLSDTFLKEVIRALADHELIKVRIGGEDRDELEANVDTIMKATKATLVQVIGHIGVFYRPAKKPVIDLVTGRPKVAKKVVKSKKATKTKNSRRLRSKSFDS